MIDSRNLRGSIRELYECGMAWIAFDGNTPNRAVPTSELGQKVQCDTKTGICEGNRVVDTENHPGKAREVFSNNKTWMNFDRNRSDRAVPTNSLGKAK